jgi:hypothetical protein
MCQDQLFVKLIIVGKDGTAFPARDGFHGMETESSHIGQTTHWSTIVTGTDGMGSVFYENEPEFIADSADFLNLHHLSGEIHRYDRFGAGRNAGTDALRVYVIGFRIYVGKNRLCATVNGAVGTGSKSHGGGNNLVTGAKSSGQTSAVKRRRPVTTDNGVGRARVFGQLSFGLIDLGATGDIWATKDVGHGLDVFLPYPLATIEYFIVPDRRSAKNG